MGDKHEAFGQMAVAPPATEATFAIVGRGMTANLAVLIASKQQLGFDRETFGILERFERTSEYTDKGMKVARELYSSLVGIEGTWTKKLKETSSTTSPVDIERISIESTEKMIKMGFKKEEASYLVGKALIELGLKEPMQKMLSFAGTDAQVINAFMMRMRAIAHAKERTEKAEGDIKRVLAEHNVTERKYEAA